VALEIEPLTPTIKRSLAIRRGEGGLRKRTIDTNYQEAPSLEEGSG
jgi:hypothetical protein